MSFKRNQNNHNVANIRVISSYPGALKYFNRALEQVKVLGDEVCIEEWEPLLNNLGHCHRLVGYLVNFIGRLVRRIKQ